MKWLKILKKDSSIVLLGNISASAFGLLNFLFMVRATSAKEFGLVAMFLSAAGLAELLRTGFIRQALVRFWVTSEPEDENSLIGSAWLLHLIIGIIIVILCFLMYWLSDFFLAISNQNLILYYPLLLVATIPHQMQSWLAHASKRYKEMNIYRLIANIFFLIFLLWNFNAGLNASEIILLMVVANGAVSLFSLLYFKSILKVVYAKRERINELLNFGKFSLSTLAGSNLLKSTDTLIIGLLINAEAAGIYALPFKAIEVLEIPLRSFVMTSFPILTSHFKNNSIKAFIYHFNSKTLRLTILFLPIALVSLFFPKIIVDILGGTGFQDGNSILRVLSLAMVLLPLDKFTGMALDSVNLPNINAKKVWIMVLINIIGDLLVISLEGPLWMFAAITIANIITGILFGLMKNPFIKGHIFTFSKKTFLYRKSTNTVLPSNDLE